MKIKKVILLILAVFYVVSLASCGFAANFNKLKNGAEDLLETTAPTDEPTAEPTERPTERPTEDPRSKVDEIRMMYNEFYERAEAIERFAEESGENAMTQSDMNISSYEVYCEWDELLNDIYNYLKKIMDKNEFAELEADEIDWIKEKEAAIDKAGK